jgi:hypothetical protein
MATDSKRPIELRVVTDVHWNPANGAVTVTYTTIVLPPGSKILDG